MEGDWYSRLAAADMDAISIHTLRVEGDFLRSFRFISTPPISIHTLRVEGDGGVELCSWAITGYFNPHPPRGG